MKIESNPHNINENNFIQPTKTTNSKKFKKGNEEPLTLRSSNYSQKRKEKEERERGKKIK